MNKNAITDERFEEWVKELLLRNSAQNLTDLTSDMLAEEIKETEANIDNEKLWEKGSAGTAAAMHRNNVINLKEYLLFLEDMLSEEDIAEKESGIADEEHENAAISDENEGVNLCQTT